MERIRARGKFFCLGDQKWYAKGVSYGPFALNSLGQFLPERSQANDDFAHMRDLGANVVRVYHTPPDWLLDDALGHGLRVFVDVPWDKHRCFFEDWNAQQEARRRVRETAKSIGNHPAMFAISVVNEFPNDVVRFSGRRRIERFVAELIDEAKQAAPDCLATFVNYPTTEFLQPRGCDFCCQNVYLHDVHVLGRYLDRLQHIAGDVPLILGEYGIDSFSEGEDEQARLLSQHVDRVFRHGLAGSFVFSYTDDWFTGGNQIEDWAFGVTNAQRKEKLAAKGLRGIWQKVPHSRDEDLPPVSVVVCSYNGAATLHGCLDSLMKLDYPDFEIILVDDGSTDDTPQIAADFPQVRHIRQENRGLSVARNVGAEAANGEIVAYTDDDCVVDRDWLTYLVQAMRDQQVQAIGGPNLPPPTDSWVAKCVAASPGGPSHVMLDDRYAEHVPGCNMAFYRDELLDLGGFDPQFRQAGDDVDVCWRFLDAGKKIGYAPGAMVWHHRRSTAKAYFKQQKGYGRSEAMVHFKHPQRFDALGKSNWKGVIYGDGAVGLPVLPPLIYHGRFGSAPFQTIYQQNRYSILAWVTSIEWHAVALFILALGAMFPWLILASLAMWSATLCVTVRSALAAPLDKGAPRWCRPLIWWLYLAQPVVRGWKRHTHLLRNRKLPPRNGEAGKAQPKRIDSSQWDLYWDNNQALGREQLLAALSEETREASWSGDFDDSWTASDIKLVGDRWHEIEIRTATEELGWPRRFTRARCSVNPTFFARTIAFGSLTWTAAAILKMQVWPLVVAFLLTTLSAVCFVTSRRKCLRAATELIARAAKSAGLTGADTETEPVRKDPQTVAAEGGKSQTVEDQPPVTATSRE